MNLRSAAKGFLAFLLSVAALQANGDGTVTYSSSNVCGSRGATVDISCTFEYADDIQYEEATVNSLWFTKGEESQPVDLEINTNYTGRVKYICKEIHCSNNRCRGQCTLRIKDLRQSDSAVYKFRFTTRHGRQYTGVPGVTLSVTDLGERICSYPSSSALQGNGITYPSCNVCALRGATVDISCTFEYADDIRHEEATVNSLWFTKGEESQPVDLEINTNYTDRVEYICKEIHCVHHRCYGTCTLRIEDLRQSDSACYKFRFTTRHGRQYTGVPGVTLSVTDLRVKVSIPSPISSPDSKKLECLSMCDLAGDPTYIWFRNGHKVGDGKWYWNQPEGGETFSCAVEGYKHLRSPVVYAPKTPSVTVSPSGEVEEGSSVTLSCSSDANPAANYTWFKEHGSAIESGQNQTITDITSEHGGNYYCQAHNEIGRHDSTFLFIKVTSSSSQRAMVAVTTIGFLLATILLLLVFLWMRRKRSSRRACGQGGRPDTMEEVSALTNLLAPAPEREQIEDMDDLHYAIAPLRNGVPGESDQTEVAETSELKNNPEI